MKDSNSLIAALQSPGVSLSEIEFILSIKDAQVQKEIRDGACQIKRKAIGNVVHYRGLIEFSNLCEKDCLYCGIRGSNPAIKRYELTLEEALSAAMFAWKSGYGSIVIQTGERTGAKFVSLMEEVVAAIKNATKGELGITLSCGEQTADTYARWFKAGAHRYLLRMETSNPELYGKIHPDNAKHSFARRLESLKIIKQIGYQLGTGVMIGLPDQTTMDLARDLLFFRELDVDMVGMGPYIEHSATPLYDQRERLLPLTERYHLSQLMISALRIMMSDINIAAATALQAIKWNGREEAILSGANIIMPNITPRTYRSQYLLYENKPCTDEHPEMCKNCLESRLRAIGEDIGYNQWGDSTHHKNRKNQSFKNILTNI